MSESSPAAEAQQRAAGLRRQLEAVTRQTADVAEYSARVQDELAETHEQLPRPVLTPEALREHAERDRSFAAEERRSADELRDT